MATVSKQQQQQRASSAKRPGPRERDGSYIHVAKVEIRASTSLGSQQGQQQQMSGGGGGAGTRTLVPRANALSSGARPSGKVRPATAPKKMNVQGSGGSGQDEDGGGQGGGGGGGGGGGSSPDIVDIRMVGGQRGAKKLNMQLDVDNSASQGNVKMQGSALVRPSSAVVARPSSSKNRPPSYKAVKPPTAASAASTQGSRPGTSQWTDENLGVKEDLSAIDSDDDQWDNPKGLAGLPPRHPGSVGGMDNIGRIGGRFDFTTMEDGAADDVETRAERAHTAGSARPGSGRVVLDKNSGRTAKVTGIPTDMYQTVRSYTGEKFEKKRTTEVQDMLQSKQKYGFRSTALQLQVGLAEKLRLALDNEAKFDIYREMFDEVIRVDASYSELLASIKAAYDDRLALVPVGDEDYVSFAAFQQQEQETQRQAAIAEEALGECERLRAMAADASAARAFLAAKAGGGMEDDDEEGFEGRGNSPRAEREEALEAKIRMLEGRVGELSDRLEEEALERVRVEELLSRLSAEQQSTHLELGGLGHGRPHEGDSPRDTARSAASGYDDHPTHRPEEQVPPRPDSVPALSEDAWNLVQIKRKEEEAEEAAWAAQDEAAAVGDADVGYGHDDDDDDYEEEEEEGQEYYGNEEEEEYEEELMRQHYERQIRQLQDEQGLDEDDAVELLMRQSRGEGRYEEEDDEEEEEGDYEMPRRPESRIDGEGGGGFRPGEGSGDESAYTEEEGDSYSQSDRTLSQSEAGSSFVSDTGGGLTGRGVEEGPFSARMDAVAEEDGGATITESPAPAPAPSQQPVPAPRVFCG